MMSFLYKTGRARKHRPARLVNFIPQQPFVLFDENNDKIYPWSTSQRPAPDDKKAEKNITPPLSFGDTASVRIYTHNS